MTRDQQRDCLPEVSILKENGLTAYNKLYILHAPFLEAKYYA